MKKSTFLIRDFALIMLWAVGIIGFIVAITRFWNAAFQGFIDILNHV